MFGDCENNFYDVVLQDGKCTVPWEVIKAPFFTVSVFCGDLVTANTIRVEVEKSGYCEGKNPGEPTPDIYNQLLNSVKPPYIGENGNWFVWDKDKKLFADSGINAKGNIPQKGVDYWNDEDKAEIKNYVDEAILGGAW